MVPWVILLVCFVRAFFSQSADEGNVARLCATFPRFGNLEKSRIFNQLSENELNEVLDFLVNEAGFYQNARSDSKTKPSLDGPNFVHRVELFEPDKGEVLTFLDQNGKEPKRYAKASIVRPSNDPKDVMEYKIGPLPLSIGEPKSKARIGMDGNDSPVEGVIMKKLRKDGEIPFYKRPAEAISTSWSTIAIAKEAYDIRQIFKESVGYCYGYDYTDTETIEASAKECGEMSIGWLKSPSIDLDPTKRIMGVSFFFRPILGKGTESLLHPIPISFKVNETGDNEEEWEAFDFEYCHQGPFNSSETLLKAHQNDELVKCIVEAWKAETYDESWSRTDIQDNGIRPGSEIPSPRSFYPNGHRFRIKADPEYLGSGFKFEYLGWEGHVGVRMATGIVLHDIRFRGNRIVYELALQDQFVSYSGYSGAGQTLFMDSYFGIGLNSLGLKRGVDCPETAQYFPVTKMGLEGTIFTGNDVICVFEEDEQTSEWRHTHYGGVNGLPHIDATRRSSLVIRTIATITNYDYIYSIRFKPDASIEVETRQAGYMLTTFFDMNGQTANDFPFGTRVQNYTFANLHDHLSGWKVDVDVLGTKNRIRRQSVKAGTWKDALESIKKEGRVVSPPWHQGSYVKYVEKKQMNKEFGFIIRDPGTVIHTFVNNNFNNSWGEPKGYAILHGMTARQLLPDDHPFTKAAAWTKYHLAITQRKENEPWSHNAVYDLVSPGKPVTSFDQYLNGESIVDQDLVAWVTMGIIHVSRSEDIPLISNSGTQFFIKPWNYYDALVSLDFGNVETFDACYSSLGNAYDYSWRL